MSLPGSFRGWLAWHSEGGRTREGEILTHDDDVVVSTFECRSLRNILVCGRHLSNAGIFDVSVTVEKEVKQETVHRGI